MLEAFVAALNEVLRNEVERILCILFAAGVMLIIAAPFGMLMGKTTKRGDSSEKE